MPSIPISTLHLKSQNLHSSASAEASTPAQHPDQPTYANVQDLSVCGTDDHVVIQVQGACRYLILEAQVAGYACLGKPDLVRVTQYEVSSTNR